MNPEPPQMPKKLRKNRDGIRTQIEQKLEKLNEFLKVQGSIKPSKVSLHIEQQKVRKTMGKS